MASKLDFVWASDSLAVSAVLWPCVPADLLPHNQLPNATHPSDHLPVGAVLRLKAPGEAQGQGHQAGSGMWVRVRVIRPDQGCGSGPGSPGRVRDVGQGQGHQAMWVRARVIRPGQGCGSGPGSSGRVRDVGQGQGHQAGSGMWVRVRVTRSGSGVGRAQASGSGSVCGVSVRGQCAGSACGVSVSVQSQAQGSG